jgi:hypothetical protein
MKKIVFGMLSAAVMLPMSAQAIEIINLDTVDHHIIVDVGKASEQEFVIVPNGKWKTNFAHVEVQVPDSKTPKEVFTLMDQDIWAIWKGGDFVVQQHRKNQGHAK